MIQWPRVVQRPSPNYSPTPIKHDLFVFHMMEGGYAGSVAWLCQKGNASAHLLMREDGLELSQLVPLSMKAWAQKEFNGRAISLEIPGYTAKGVPDERWAAAALVAAWACRIYRIPPVWAQGGQGRGLCQHHDLGAAGGGHVDCSGVGSPTWLKLVGMVQKIAGDLKALPSLPDLGVHGLPNPLQCQLPTECAVEPSHGGQDRSTPGELPLPHQTQSGYPHGSVADLQWRLNLVGAFPKLKVDGLAGRLTRNAISHFQATRGLYIDGLAGPKTWDALDRATLDPPSP